MVYRWRCRHCEFAAWSANRPTLLDAVRSHLGGHHRDRVRRGDFRTSWRCPYCEATGRSHDEADSRRQFERHLVEHAEPLVESGVHVADDVDRTGDVMVLAPAGSQGADNARIHFLSPADIAIFVTTTPAERLRLLEEQFSEWPASTVVVTTKHRPLEGLAELDLSDVPIEVVQLDKRIRLSDLGETISRIVDEHETANGKIAMEFDVLPEMVDKFKLQDLFQFLHVLSARMERAGALSYYRVDPDDQPESTLNVLAEIFDLTVRADDRTFTLHPKSG